MKFLIDRRCAQVIAENWVPAPRLTLVVLPHEYFSPVQQWNLYQQTEIFLDHSSAPTLFTDDFEGRIPQTLGPAVVDRERRQNRANKLLRGRFRTVGMIPVTTSRILPRRCGQSEFMMGSNWFA